MSKRPAAKPEPRGEARAKQVASLTGEVAARDSNPRHRADEARGCNQHH